VGAEPATDAECRHAEAVASTVGNRARPLA